jgi:hypothetical protein
MIGGQGRLFGRAVTSFIAFFLNLALCGGAEGCLILAKSLLLQDVLAVWRNNKDATVRVHQIDFGCLGRIYHFGVIRALS